MCFFMAIKKIYFQHINYSNCLPLIFIGWITYFVIEVLYEKLARSLKGDIKTNSAEYSNDLLDDDTPALPINLQHIRFQYKSRPEFEIQTRSKEYLELLQTRRSIRHFSKKDVPIEIIRNLIQTAANSPSGVHTEPWSYILVKNQKMKQKVRDIVEYEEEINYKTRMGKTWTTDLKPLRTNWIKEYLTDAPYLIFIFKKLFSTKPNGIRRLHYYNEKSVCLSAGLLLSAIHYAGLVALVSTPLNCGSAFRNLLHRPMNEKFVFLIPVGYPADNAFVPDLKRKNIKEYCIEII